jgi:molybdopterin converting factor small subunit
MFSGRRDITVNVKLYTSLLRETGIKEYDPYKGMRLKIPAGTRMWKVAKILGLSRRNTVICLVNGERVGPWKKMAAGDEIAFFRPVAGG